MEKLWTPPGAQEHYWINMSDADQEAKSLRVQAFCHSIYYPEWRVSGCLRPNYMVSLVLEGSEYAQLPTGDQRRILPGLFRISDLNRDRTDRHPKIIRRTRLERYFILLEFNPLLNVLLDQFFPAGLPQFYVNDMSKMREAFEAVRDALAESRQDDAKIGSALFRLLCEAARLRPGMPQPQALMKAQRYIDSCFCKPGLDRAEIAEAAGISISMLGKLFRSHLNCTVHEAVFRKRMEKVKRLLLYSDLAISSIAEECGFRYAYYLAREFKKNFGLTPLQYRRRGPEETDFLP